LIDIILHYFKNFKLIVRKEKPHVNNITQCRKEGTWFSNYFFIIIEKIYINLFKFNYCRTQQDFLTLTITIINTNIRVINNTHIYIDGTKNQIKQIPIMWARSKRKWIPTPTLHLHLKLSNTYKAHSSKCFLGFKSCAHKFFAQRYTHFLCRWGNGYSLPTLLYRKHNNQWQR